MPQNERGEIALTCIHGIGWSSSTKISSRADISRDLKVSEWFDDQTARTRETIGAELEVEDDLRSETRMNIRRFMDVDCYHGIRHRSSLPVRGRGVRNGARTYGGKKKVVVNKKKATK